MDFDKLTGPIDVKKMVDIGMTAEKAKHLRRFEISKKIDDVQLASFAKLQDLFTSLQTALTDLTTAFNTVAYQASSTNPAVATTSVTSNAVSAGTHSINVTQLATAQTNASSFFGSASYSLGLAETLTITNSTNPANTFNISVNTGDSLQDICNNINNSASNTFGISASVISSVANDGVTPQYTLVISSEETGTNNAFSITDPNAAFQFTQSSAAQNAKFTFDNYNQVSQSNVIGDSDGSGGVIAGLSFTLLATGTTTLNIAPSGTNQNAAVQDAMNTFVSAYNNIMVFIDQSQADSSTYNLAYSNIKSKLQNALNNTFNNVGDINTLTRTGLTLAPFSPQKQIIKSLYTDKDREVSFVETGMLMLNTNITQGAVFTNVLSDDFASLASFFTGSNGLINNLNNVINDTITPDTNQGLIYNATTAIENDKSNVNEQIKTQEKILEQIRDRLTLKWTKANSTFAKLEMTSKYLEKQFASMANFGNDT